MSTLVRQRREHKLRNGVYRAVIADIEDNISSRFNSREDLIRVALDLVNEVEGQKPRLWFISAPNLHGRLEALVEAALGRKLTEDEAEGFELDGILGKEVNVVVAQTPNPSGFMSSQIITFLPVEAQ